uniref:Secreted protein n=1 Tax=Thraustotheca clavata TaxID=74557 RepID=A0A0A7CM97_9STRA|nr:secreted protein [Thraustotheca clavata]
MHLGWTLAALTTIASAANTTITSAANTIPTTGWVNPLIIKGYKFFDSVTGNEFRIKGIGIYPRANAGKQYDANSVDWFSDDMEAIWQPQLANLQALGVNTIRIYAVDPTKSHDKFMCALNKLGMYAFVGMSAVCEGCYILDEAAPGCYSSAMFTRAQMIYNAFAVYDNVIGFSVGNENNLGKTINLSAPCVKALIRDVRAYGQNCAGSLRQIPIVLMFGFNQYVECDPQKDLSYDLSAGLQKLMSDYAKSNYSRPIVFGEFGCIKIKNTIDNIEQQRTFLDAKWMNTEPAMTEYVAGGNAFEYSVEKANLIDKTVTPPFASADAGRYGIGYFTPGNCDFNSTPCVYNKYPEFDNLGKAYNATPASTLTASSFKPARSGVLSCPADFPTSLLPGTPSVPILSCSVAQPVCNGGASNKHKITGTGSVTVAPQKKLVSGQSGGDNSTSDSPSTSNQSPSLSLAFGTLIISTTAALLL